MLKHAIQSWDEAVAIPKRKTVFEKDHADVAFDMFLHAGKLVRQPNTPHAAHLVKQSNMTVGCVLLAEFWCCLRRFTYVPQAEQPEEALRLYIRAKEMSKLANSKEKTFHFSMLLYNKVW